MRNHCATPAAPLATQIAAVPRPKNGQPNVTSINSAKAALKAHP